MTNAENILDQRVQLGREHLAWPLVHDAVIICASCRGRPESVLQNPRGDQLTERHLLFDIETNGLMPGVDTVHCIGFADVHTGELFSFPPDNIEEALRQLYEADCLSGHNIIGYDFKVLKKLYDWDPRPGCRVIDTMVVARTMHSDIKKDDFLDEPFKVAGGKIGGHRLKDWGIRLGEHKAEYDGGWETYTPEMLTYMMQDVKTNVRLLQHLKPHEYPRAPLELEHRVQEVVYQIEAAGWPFDSKKAADLYGMLCAKRDVLEKALIDKFGSWHEIDRIVVPKRDNKTLGYVKGVPVTHWKTVVFNPGSRVHIEKKLRDAGWEPEEFTPSGRAMLNDEVLEGINLPAAQELIDYLLIQKRVGQIADGDNGWLRVVSPEGRIHTYYNPMGTPHSRASHSKPNIAQVPNAHSLYGPECRELFRVPPGWNLVGADMAGCQLRVLGHYIGAFDGGKYGRIVTQGDIHTFHMEAAAPDVKTRDASKTTIYALIFGGAAPRLGAINGGNAAMGKRIMTNLRTKIPGFDSLLKAVDGASAKGYLKGLDGRHVPVRSKHSALNFLIASGEAILCKTWLCNAYDELCAKYKWGWAGDVVIVGWVHDEIQCACKSALADDVAEILVKHARAAGDAYGFRVALDSSAKIGKTWRDTH